MSKFIQHLCSLDIFRTSSVHHQECFVQAVFADLVCGNSVHTTRHVQPWKQPQKLLSSVAYLKSKLQTGTFQQKSTCRELLTRRLSSLSYNRNTSAPVHARHIEKWMYGSIHSQPRNQMEMSDQFLPWALYPSYTLNVWLNWTQKRFV